MRIIKIAFSFCQWFVYPLVKLVWHCTAIYLYYHYPLRIIPFHLNKLLKFRIQFDIRPNNFIVFGDYIP